MHNNKKLLFVSIRLYIHFILQFCIVGRYITFSCTVIERVGIVFWVFFFHELGDLEMLQPNITASMTRWNHFINEITARPQ